MDRPDAKRPPIVMQNGGPSRRRFETRVPHQRTVGENANACGVRRACQGFVQRTPPRRVGERRNGARRRRTNRHQRFPTSFGIFTVENLRFKCILLTIPAAGSAARRRQDRLPQQRGTRRKRSSAKTRKLGRCGENAGLHRTFSGTCPRKSRRRVSGCHSDRTAPVRQDDAPQAPLRRSLRIRVP